MLTGYTFTDSEHDSDSFSSQLTYDEIGNITSFNGSTYAWTAGRQLAESTDKDGDKVRYYYNENGFLSRVDIYDKDTDEVGSILQFTWDGDRLVSRTALDPTGSYAITSKIIYDTDGESIGFCVDTNINPADCPEEQIGVPLGVYLYEKNLQGDVVKVIHGATGTVLAKFSYDAYGNLEVHADNLGEVIGAILIIAITPQLYRGYIYVPLGDNLCYYLGSRFYNPQLGRFLNADKHTDTGTGVNGTNMFTYCNNNPTILKDPTGEAANFIERLASAFKRIFALVQKLSSLFTGGVKTQCIWPMKDEYNHKITSRWGFRKFDGKHHQGIDIRAETGTPVLAVMDGTVVTLNKSRSDSQGIYMVLKHTMNGITFYTRYMHLKEIKQGLVVGSNVFVGEEIAKSGNSAKGNSTVADHLHFQIQFDNTSSRSQTINPYEYHKDDKRYGRDNPNPFYILQNGLFVFNNSFDPALSKKYLENNDWSVSTDTSYRR